MVNIHIKTNYNPNPHFEADRLYRSWNTTRVMALSSIYAMGTLAAGIHIYSSVPHLPRTESSQGNRASPTKPSHRESQLSASQHPAHRNITPSLCRVYTQKIASWTVSVFCGRWVFWVDARDWIGKKVCAAAIYRVVFTMRWQFSALLPFG